MITDTAMAIVTVVSAVIVTIMTQAEAICMVMKALPPLAMTMYAQMAPLIWRTAQTPQTATLEDWQAQTAMRGTATVTHTSMGQQRPIGLLLHITTDTAT